MAEATFSSQIPHPEKKKKKPYKAQTVICSRVMFRCIEIFGCIITSILLQYQYVYH